MIIIVILRLLLSTKVRVKKLPSTQTQPNEATQLLVVRNPKNARTTNHITSSGEMRPPFNFRDIVAENGGRGHTEVTVCMYE